MSQQRKMKQAAVRSCCLRSTYYYILNAYTALKSNIARDKLFYYTVVLQDTNVKSCKSYYSLNLRLLAGIFEPKLYPKLDICLAI